LASELGWNHGSPQFSLFILRAFGLTDFHAYLSTRPEKAVGREGAWSVATEALKAALEAHALSFDIDHGGGAFYGPKIDLTVKDALGRSWQLSTIQFDFNLPERFGLEYIDTSGNPRRPYMVHRALLGSMERFFGVLIEHFGGAFPLWLSPVQATVLPVTGRNLDYVNQVAETLREAALRVEVDEGSERLDAKIRDAQLQKLPYMLVVGDKEQAAETVSPRLRSGEKLRAMPINELVQRMTREVQQHL
jgi:threonyl-tRNA synthetase